MLRTRVIPVLLLRGESLVKTVRFGRFSYVGDPCNTVRIFNELEVDELCVLDITATRERRSPNLALLADIANECFMPLSYGGGIRSLRQAETIFKIGFEKIIVNSAALERPEVVREVADHFGSQAVVVSIDVAKNLLGHAKVRSRSGTRNTHRDPIAWAREAERLGAGEILLTSIDREGTWSGFDIDLLRSVTEAVGIPVIAHGGGGQLLHLREAVRIGGASAVALGSMVVFQKQGMGVLVNFPHAQELEATLAR
ncbi:MAG: AglZ/HisF2 family acetamidino modification protein [Rubrivivax sp.]|nr:AglZ/HisF2 family acetamidino modification protein [Rubrivivax sp.]